MNVDQKCPGLQLYSRCMLMKFRASDCHKGDLMLEPRLLKIYSFALLLHKIFRISYVLC